MQYFAKHLFDGTQFKNDCLIQVDQKRIIGVKDGTPEQADVVLEGTLVPGFIDVQVNGGGGKLFNNTPTLATLETMSAAHQQFGTTGMLPTVITDDVSVMQKAANAVALGIEEQLSCILGIHFEGPHLSQPKKGIHPDNHIRPISDAELALFTRKDIGKVHVTVAPETVPTDVIKDLIAQGVIVSLGHSNATAQQTINALKAGATGFTHLFNAMSSVTGREAGMLGVALLDSDAFCGLIVDGEHVGVESCQLAIKCKSPQKIMLVTDAMSHVGSDQTELTFAGMTIRKNGNKLTIENGRLAGSALDMATAVRNTVNDLKVSLGEALVMASSTPAAFLSLENQKGFIREGFDADWVTLTNDFHVKSTYVGGHCAYANNKN